MKRSLLFFLLLLSVKAFSQNTDDVQGTWNGNVTMNEKYSGLIGTSDRHIEVTIKANMVTGTHKYTGDVIIEGKHLGHDECYGSGPGELHALNIRTWDSTYDIGIITPECKLVAGGGNSGTGGTEIGISNQRLLLNGKQLNTTELKGTETVVREIPGVGTYTATITWDLVRDLDVELIVTPEGFDADGLPETYDEWLPEPGKDETSKGSYMKITMRLQSKSHQPLKYKASQFVLRLVNTSREPGITVNYPISPRANQLPDLRFIPMVVAESNSEDQGDTISAKNGVTGETFIASYDGGGYTTLNVEAILTEGIHIKGQLLVSGGDEDIRIPKRDVGAFISKDWLAKNGNPAEMDDKETEAKNHNAGDGLTAYEEYRGVISLDTFRRLSPKKKELGVLLRKSEVSIFRLGIKRFEAATGIKVLLFNNQEIPENRRLNQNSGTDHDFNQFVLRLQKGNTKVRDMAGREQTPAWGYTYPTHDIPARVTHIVIDVDRIRAGYLTFSPDEGLMTLPFDAEDLIASTTAHEMGHGCNLPHHGRLLPILRVNFSVDTRPPLIFRANANRRWEITDRPYTISSSLASPGDHQSGNVSCFMCYRNKCDWVKVSNNNGVAYYWIPWMKAGSIFCEDAKGTGIKANN